MQQTGLAQEFIVTQTGRFQNTGCDSFKKHLQKKKNQQNIVDAFYNHFISTVCGDDIRKGL